MQAESDRRFKETDGLWNGKPRGRASSFDKGKQPEIKELTRRQSDGANRKTELSQPDQQSGRTGVPSSNHGGNTPPHDQPQQKSNGTKSASAVQDTSDDGLEEKKEEQQRPQRSRGSQIHQRDQQSEAPSGSETDSRDNGSTHISVKLLLQEMRLADSDDVISKTQGVSLSEVAEMKKLAFDVVTLQFQYTLEDKVAGPSMLSRQVHQTAIENLCYTLNYLFPLFSFFFMRQCVGHLRRNSSVLSSQQVLRKLVEGTAFPILMVKEGKEVCALQQALSLAKVRLPKNQTELILALDSDLKLTTECLYAYVEFKRQSVQLIFDRFAANMENEMIGGLGGDHDENLETQSSLYNNTNQNTGEERSRFSKSIVSSTHKSDTAGSMSNVHAAVRSTQRRKDGNNLLLIDHERGQSLPKQVTQMHKPATKEPVPPQHPIFDTEPYSATTWAAKDPTPVSKT